MGARSRLRGHSHLSGLKSAALCDKAVAFQNAYESVQEIIRATEAEDYADYLRTAATAVVAESARACSLYLSKQVQNSC